MVLVLQFLRRLGLVLTFPPDRTITHVGTGFFCFFHFFFLGLSLLTTGLLLHCLELSSSDCVEFFIAQFSYSPRYLLSSGAVLTNSLCRSSATSWRSFLPLGDIFLPWVVAFWTSSAVSRCWRIFRMLLPPAF